jgi:hypothetical protein
MAMLLLAAIAAMVAFILPNIWLLFAAEVVFIAILILKAFGRVEL